MECRPAVAGHAHQLNLVGDLAQIAIAPAGFSPVRHERATDGSVQHDEFGIGFVEVIGEKDFGVSSKVVAVVGAVDGADVRGGGDECCGVRGPVEDENEISGSVKAVGEEELEVDVGGRGLGEGVED